MERKMKKNIINKKKAYYPVEELYKWVNQPILCLVGCNKADWKARIIKLDRI